MLRESYCPAVESLPLLKVTVGDLLVTAATEAPTATALVDGVAAGSRRRWSYAELLRDAQNTATVLRSRFHKGDRVGLYAGNSADWLIIELGAALAGVVLVPLNPAYRAHEVRYVLNQARASGLIHADEGRGAQLARIVDEVRGDLPGLEKVYRLDDIAALGRAETAPWGHSEVSCDDPLLIQYTSGTTGFPKGAVVSHYNAANTTRSIVHRGRLATNDVWINPMPMFHVGGSVMASIGAISAHAAQVLSGGFDPGFMLQLIEEEGGTILSAVPTMLIALLEHPDFDGQKLSSLRLIFSGSTTVPAELSRHLESQLALQVCVCYGMTETTSVATCTQPTDSVEDRANTSGFGLPDIEVKVIDSLGEIVAVDVAGEICMKGPGIIPGYFEMPEATAEAIDEQGWVHSGDLGRMDERGYLSITGRLKDMIIRGGENIYPREIEDTLFEHPGVAEAAVVGVPDARWGEQIMAFVRLSGNGAVDDAELRRYLSTRIARHKIPTYWRFVASFPMTPSGKIQKFVLREQLAKEGDLDES